MTQGARSSQGGFFLAQRIVRAAEAQRRELPAAGAKGALAAELAGEALREKERLAVLEARLEELVAKVPQAKIIRSLPGMGASLTAELVAEAGDLLSGATVRPIGWPPRPASPRS